jgi:hypothetical protein
MQSRIWDAQDALLTALQANATLSEVTLDLGAPGRLERQHVWISGEVEDWSLAYTTSGLVSRDEEFNLRIHVLVTMTGRSYVDARTRVVELGQAVEDVIADDVTLAGTVMLATVARGSIDEATGGDGRTRSVLLTIHVRCNAHVS